MDKNGCDQSCLKPAGIENLEAPLPPPAGFLLPVHPKTINCAIDPTAAVQTYPHLQARPAKRTQPANG